MSIAAKITLKDLVRRTENLPVFSQTAHRIMKLADKSDVTALQMANEISSDPAIAIRVLRLANSAFYGMPKKVSELRQAVVILGNKSVRSLALAAASYPWISKTLPGYRMGPQAMLVHSFGTAHCARMVAEASGKVDSNSAFTAGLIHDIGKVAMDVNLVEKTDALIYLSKREKIHFDETERRVFGFDHAEVGAFLAEQWNIPDELLAAIRFHHATHRLPDVPPIVDCVHIGIHLVEQLGFGLSADGQYYGFDENSLERLGIQVRMLDEIADNLKEVCEEHNSLFDLLEAA